MTVLHAVLYGLTAALRQKRVILILYMMSLGFGFLLILPVVTVLFGDLGHSLAADGAESFLDVSIIADFLRARDPDLRTYHQAASGMFLLFLLASTFLTGGLLELLVRPRGGEFPSRFFGGCGQFFFRFLRLLGFHIAALFLIAALNLGLAWLLRSLFDDTTFAITATLFLGLKQGLIFALLVGTAALFDYARILTVLQDRGNMSGTLLGAAGFVFRNLKAVVLIRLLMIGAGAALLLVYWGIHRWILPEAAWISLLVVQQLLILIKQFLKVFRYGAELNLLRGREVSEDARLLARITSPEAMENALR